MEDSHTRVLQSTGFFWIAFTIESAANACPGGSLPLVATILWDQVSDIDLAMLGPDNETVYYANNTAGIYGRLTADSFELGPESIVVDRNPVVEGQVFKFVVWCFAGCDGNGTTVNINVAGNSINDFE
eukprot:2121903-Ditylum_brightwellii.AAC.1